jgi:hypothetical protein
MSEWTSRIRDHRIWELMRGLGPTIDKVAQLDDLDPAALEALERIRSVLAFCGKRLGGSEPLTTLPAPLDAIEAFITDRNLTHLTNANQSADSALANLAQVPGPSTPEELIGLIEAVAFHTAALEQQERLSSTARKQSTAEVNDLTAALEALKVQTQSTIAELKSQVDAERQKISAQAAEQQKAFTDAQQARSNTYSETLLKIQENLTKTLTDQQGQFSAAQENRGREFTAAQTDSQKRFGDLIADYTKRLADQDVEFARQRDSFVAIAEKQLTDLNKGYEEAARKILEQVNTHRKDVEKLVGVIGNLGVTSGYQTAANGARISMWVWQGVAVLAMLGLVSFAYFAFLPAMKGGFTWEGFAMRAFLTVTVGVLAAYAANQADRFFQMEKYNRKLALELAAIDPYIALLPEEKKNKFKIEIGQRSFGQEEAPSLKAEKSPATTLDVVAGSKTLQQIVQLFSDIVQKLPKAG